jgi:hypothetical protein
VGKERASSVVAGPAQLNEKFMKKAAIKKKAGDEMRPEYDFRGAVRGKHYKPLHRGYSVHIHKINGTTIVKNFKLQDGTVMLQPDVRKYFPDSEAVNTALRSLIALMSKLPSELRTFTQKKRSTNGKKGGARRVAP